MTISITTKSSKKPAVEPTLSWTPAPMPSDADLLQAARTRGRPPGENTHRGMVRALAPGQSHAMARRVAAGEAHEPGDVEAIYSSMSSTLKSAMYDVDGAFKLERGSFVTRDSSTVFVVVATLEGESVKSVRRANAKIGAKRRKR